MPRAGTDGELRAQTSTGSEHHANCSEGRDGGRQIWQWCYSLHFFFSDYLKD